MLYDTALLTCTIGNRMIDCLFIVTSISICIAVILSIQILKLKKCLRRQRDIEQELRYYGEYDILTGLKNRNGFAKSTYNLQWEHMTVLVCDIDGLKIINDTLGHWAGDQLIKNAAKLLNKVCSLENLLFRMGGDEFLILLPEGTKEQGMAIYSKLKEELRYNQKTEKLPLSLSVGVASGSAANGDSFTDIIQQADYLMYQEKRIYQERVRGNLKGMLKK